MDESILINDNLNNIDLDIESQNLISNITENAKLNSIEEDNNLTIGSDNSIYTLDLRISDFESEGEMKKFINKVKNAIRQSYEYRLWVKYVKDVLNVDSCILSNEHGSELTIELHHHPISLENIVLAILNTKINNDIKFCSFDIAMEAIELHYKLKIGFVPLITSLHEKFHNGHLDLPIDMVVGDYQYLLNNYYFDEKQMELINKYMSITKDNCVFYYRQRLEDKKEVV